MHCFKMDPVYAIDFVAMQDEDMPPKKKSSKHDKKEETHGYSPAIPKQDKSKGIGIIHWNI